MGYKILIVEGKDEENFFTGLFKHMGIENVQIHDKNPPNEQNIIIYDARGKNRYHLMIPALLLSSEYWHRIDILGITRDADNDANAAFESVRQILRQQGLPVPTRQATFVAGTPEVGIFILPGDVDNGMLESLCMATVAGTPKHVDAMRYIEAAMNKAEPPLNRAKAEAAAYLAILPTLNPSVGIAAKAGCWNFDSPTLNALKQFLEKFR